MDLKIKKQIAPVLQCASGAHVLTWHDLDRNITGNDNGLPEIFEYDLKCLHKADLQNSESRSQTGEVWICSSLRNFEGPP